MMGFTVLWSLQKNHTLFSVQEKVKHEILKKY